MRETATKPVFSADPYSDPVVVRVEGRANFQNSACLRDFIQEMTKQGKKRFVIDFLHCTSMDSTFLGVLAGVAMRVREAPLKGSVVAARLGTRNMELIRNHGLHRLLTVHAEGPPNFEHPEVPIDCPDQSEIEIAKLVLEAHENLIAADESNRPKFQDVLVFLKNRVEAR